MTHVETAPNFIHSHNLKQQFTPLVETQEIRLDKNMDYRPNEYVSFVVSSEVEIGVAADENHVANNNAAVDHNAVIDTEVENVTIPSYTNYYKHSSGHLDFYNDFKNNTFGHSCAVCDRLCWEKDLKKTSRTHDNLLQIILPVSIQIYFKC